MGSCGDSPWSDTAGGTVPREDIQWHLKFFADLTVFELHALLGLRAEVFVVEQECAYLDPDHHDPVSFHILGWLDGRLVACARFYDDPPWVRLGRIATASGIRRRGFGRVLIAECLSHIGARAILIHAQAYLEPLYAEFGFRTEGPPFLEDGIPHVRMTRAP